MPGTDRQRIVTLDILRGMALFGMILVHFHQRMEKPATGAEDIVGWFVWMGVETKAWATFAFLFGAGFAILMRRAEARGLKVWPLYLRRMAALAVIGIMVQVLFGFRILLDYAIWGLVLLAIRKLSTRILLILALCSAVAGPIVGMVRPVDRQRYAAQFQSLHAAETTGTFASAVKARAANAQWWYLRPRTLVPDSNLVLFIFGLLAVRHGMFENVKRNRRTIMLMMAFGLVSWSCAWFVLPKLPEGMQSGFGIVSDQWLAFTYVGATVLLLAYRPAWQRRLNAFAIAGRMALTNYVLQAMILSVLASGYGLALKIRPLYDIPAAILLFSACVALSRAWLARFKHGPLERLWRSVTYADWHLKTINEAVV